MTPPPNSPFRTKSIERLSSPEKLDQLMEVISPKGWWWTGSLAFVTVAIVIWSIFGRIPITVMGQGVLVYLEKVTQIEGIASGRIKSLKVKLDQTIKTGDLIAIVEQPELEQQLREKQAELRLLNSQFNRENTLQNQDNSEQKLNLEQQRSNYQKQIREAEQFGRLLKDKNLAAILSQKQDILTQVQQLQTTGVKSLATNRTAITAQRQSLNEQLNKANEVLKNLQKIYTKQKELQAKELITINIILQTEQQILQIFDQNSSIKANLKQLDSQEAQLEQAQLDNNNKISQLLNQVQQLEIQATQNEQSFLENQRRIDELKSQVIQVQSQLTQLDLGTRKTLDEQVNQRQSLENDIAQLQLQIQRNGYIRSEYPGRVIDIQVQVGELVNPGQNIAKLMRSDREESLISLSFFSIGNGKQIKAGMSAEITPSTVQKKDYGGIVGTVTKVAEFPSSVEEAALLIGDADLAKSLTANNQTIGVAIQLKTDPKAYSGFEWSSRQGPNQKITQGTTTISQVTVDQRAPISFVLPFFRSITGEE